MGAQPAGNKHSPNPMKKLLQGHMQWSVLSSVTTTGHTVPAVTAFAQECYLTQNIRLNQFLYTCTSVSIAWTRRTSENESPPPHKLSEIKSQSDLKHYPKV